MGAGEKWEKWRNKRERPVLVKLHLDQYGWETQVAGGWATGRDTAAEVRQRSGHEGLQVTVRSLIIILKAVETIYVI